MIARLRAWWLGRDCGLAEVDRKGRTPSYRRGFADGRNAERASAAKLEGCCGSAYRARPDVRLRRM